MNILKLLHIFEYEVAYLDKMRGVTDINFNNNFRKRVYWYSAALDNCPIFSKFINLSQDHSF